MAASVTSDTGRLPAAHCACRRAARAWSKSGSRSSRTERKEIEGWDAPFDQGQRDEPARKAGAANRAHGAAAGRRREPVGIERRAARYGDILVLVRQRGELFEAIIRALKNENVEVAGADRLVLTEHIAVMDLMALADALLLPQDDLALATVLRSPLFGFADEDLFAIAWDRGPLSLRAALARKTGEREIFAAAAALLDKLARDARGAKRRLRFTRRSSAPAARGGASWRGLATEANDALDEFLNLALDYERRETPSLQGFLAWLREARAEVKRDMEIARDEVRVMTVHGAKGLEAPIVILADTMTPPAGPRQPRLLKLAGGAMIWAGRKADDVAGRRRGAPDGAWRSRDEYRRLLYVAMTRAADRLIVCGAEGRSKRPEGCWYDLVRGPLGPFLVEEDDGGEKVLRYRKAAAPRCRGRAPPAISARKTAERRELPSWLRQAGSRRSGACGTAVAVCGL